MAPLLAALAAKGLSLISGAVMAKGQAFVEEKLGVKLKPDMTDEDALKLKQLEFDNEESLRNWVLENRKLDNAEMADARGLGAALAASASSLNQGIVPVLAVLSLLGGVLMILLSKEADVRMAGMSIVMMPLGYYFGTSQGSKQKQEVLMKQLGDKS